MLKLTLLLLLATPALAEDRLLHVTYGDLEVTRLTYYRSYLAPEIGPRDWKGRVATHFNLGLGDYIFWDNNVHTEGTKAKVETVGWQFKTGFHLPWNVDFGFEHHSQHRMDAGAPVVHDYEDRLLYRNKFENENGYFLRFVWAGSSK